MTRPRRACASGARRRLPRCVSLLLRPLTAQIDEFTELHDRLRSSLARSLVALETIRVCLAQGSVSAANLLSLRNVADSVSDAAFGQALHDNRDFSILPNHQPAGEVGILIQTALGSTSDLGFLRPFAGAYRELLRPAARDEPPPKPVNVTPTAIAHRPSLAHYEQAESAAGSVTGPEADLLQFADKLPQLLVVFAEQGDDGKAILEHFVQCGVELAAAFAPAELPCRAIHVAQLALEVRSPAVDLADSQAFCFLDTALDLEFYPELFDAPVPAPSTPSSPRRPASVTNPQVLKLRARVKQLRADAAAKLKSIADTLASRADAIKPAAAVSRLGALSAFSQVRRAARGGADGAARVASGRVCRRFGQRPAQDAPLAVIGHHRSHRPSTVAASRVRGRCEWRSVERSGSASCVRCAGKSYAVAD